MPLPDRRIETLQDVPADRVKAVEQDFKDSGAKVVERKKQPDGKFTLLATFEAGSHYPASGEPAA